MLSYVIYYYIYAKVKNSFNCIVKKRIMSSKKEIWKTILVNGKKPSVPYAVSSHGRFGVIENGKVQVRTFKPMNGAYRYNVRQHGKSKAIFVNREVAGAFLKKPSPKHRLVIHKDHNYLNNKVSNLKWATPSEHRAHTANSPQSVLSRKKIAITSSSRSKVLSEKEVVQLKKMIWDPKRKLSYSQMAHKFGVSEMQIYRIKSGEFWYHIHVENEPLHAKYKQNLSNIAYHNKLEQKLKKSSKKKK